MGKEKNNVSKNIQFWKANFLLSHWLGLFLIQENMDIVTEAFRSIAKKVVSKFVICQCHSRLLWYFVIVFNAFVESPLPQNAKSVQTDMNIDSLVNFDWILSNRRCVHKLNCNVFRKTCIGMENRSFRIRYKESAKREIIPNTSRIYKKLT